jgi:hypothetical protein
MSNFLIASPSVIETIQKAHKELKDTSIANSNISVNAANLNVVQKRIKDEPEEGITFKGEFTPVISGAELFVTNFDRRKYFTKCRTFLL